MSVSEWDTTAAGYRVAVYDPLPVFRLGLISSLGVDAARVESTDDVNEWVQRPDRCVVLLTVRGPDDWRALGDLRAADARVVVIAVLDQPDTAAYSMAVSFGAAGVVARNATPEQMRTVYAAAIAGQMILPTHVVRQLAESRAEDSVDPGAPSALEAGWLRDLAAGLTVAELARRAGYSERMMFRLLRNLYLKMGVTQRTAALMLAHERGWLR